MAAEDWCERLSQVTAVPSHPAHRWRRGHSAAELVAADEGASGVTNWASFIGQGPPRFYLPVDPEKPYPEYAELIINFENYKEAFEFATEIEPWLREQIPEAMVRMRP